jgi:hypothetical protein
MRGAMEECPVCLQLYRFELERRCEDCDARLCPWCVIEVHIELQSEIQSTDQSDAARARSKLRKSKHICPGCTEPEDASARDVES